MTTSKNPKIANFQINEGCTKIDNLVNVTLLHRIEPYRLLTVHIMTFLFFLPTSGISNLSGAFQMLM